MTDRIGVSHGSPATSFWLEADVVETDIANNRWMVHFYLRAANGPGGTTGSSYFGVGAQVGYANGAEVCRHEANPFLPSGVPNGGLRWRDGFAVWIGANAEGYVDRTSLTMPLSMVTQYGNVNWTGTGSMQMPRIPKPPPAPAVRPLDQVGATSMRLRWSSAGNNGSSIDGWQYRIAQNAAMTGATTAAAASNGINVIGSLVSGRQYWVQVRGRNAAGWGAWSSAVTARTLQAPASPALTSAAPGEVRVTWVSPPGNLVSNVNGWDLQYADNPALDNVTGLVLSASASPYTVKGLPPGSNVYVRVRARYADALGPWGAIGWTTLLSGVYASDGEDLDPGGMYASNGARLAVAQVLFSDGDALLPAL